MFGRRLGALAAGVGMAAAIVGLVTPAPANASSRASSRQPPVVRPRFRHVGAAWMWTGARYALVGLAKQGTDPDESATLIDDQTGRVKTIGRAGCHPVEPPSALEPLDLPWVPFDCSPPVTGITPVTTGPAPELYSPATGQWLAVSPSPGITNPCADPFCDVSYFPRAAGRYWLAYDQATCMDGQHCSYVSVFQNIHTGELRQDPSGGSTDVDLNAPTLTRTVCGPLSVPTALQVYSPPGPGSLIFYGRFALSIGSYGFSIGDYGNADVKVYLERCGTHLHRLVTKAATPDPEDTLLPAANTREVVWMAHPRPFLSALTLPGLKPFTIRLPNRLIASACSPDYYLGCVSQIALTNHRLYLLTASYPSEVWAAPIALPAGRRHK
jgi:hypothetical protein